MALVRSSIIMAWKDIEFVRKLGRKSRADLRERRQQWKRADGEEGDGISVLQADVKSRLALCKGCISSCP